MSNSSDVLRQAIYLKLNTDADLVALIGSEQVFDHYAHQAKYPYILVVNWNTTDWSFDEFTGEEHRFDIEIYDDQPSQNSVHEIAKVVNRSLHDQALSLASGTLVNLRLENSFFQIQRRTSIQLSRLKFRAKIEI